MLSAYKDPEGEPAFNRDAFEKFEDTSRPIRGKFSSIILSFVSTQSNNFKLTVKKSFS